MTRTTIVLVVLALTMLLGTATPASAQDLGEEVGPSCVTIAINPPGFLVDPGCVNDLVDKLPPLPWP